MAIPIPSNGFLHPPPFQTIFFPALRRAISGLKARVRPDPVLKEG